MRPSEGDGCVWHRESIIFFSTIYTRAIADHEAAEAELDQVPTRNTRKIILHGTYGITSHVSLVGMVHLRLSV